ncbi:MAG: antitoxin [Methylicorpusculum sp.]|uniref:antitoxin n=1 Tax=Methylicorpusculum sp. TaxID=2713644 RepID=UPI00271FD8D1|nr:antitoxin [Methylicorpusculum sp.]MDO8843109.1 antitoxin [Methylicorpusculum sp.]MDO8938599.1 antitoxin [Methylicorpusculum sp.]MDO9240008.1 antitoxin [Methylicorpusculum sp.]MDP2177641.1 antitoxin [Methylicorpusculum sp.]MDP2202912.1 antitoxin [Methylicorpusculum sp.]
MSRLTIEITEQQHQSIKALAALQGISIKEYAMQRLLPLTDDEEKAIQELEAFLKPRIEAAERGDVVSTSVITIFEEALAAPRL